MTYLGHVAYNLMRLDKGNILNPTRALYDPVSMGTLNPRWCRSVVCSRLRPVSMGTLKPPWTWITGVSMGSVSLITPLSGFKVPMETGRISAQSKVISTNLHWPHDVNIWPQMTFPGVTYVMLHRGHQQQPKWTWVWTIWTDLISIWGIRVFPIDL